MPRSGIIGLCRPPIVRRPDVMAQLPPNPALAELEPLVGEWEVEVPQFPGQRGRVTCEWLEGGAYLRYHAEPPEPAPTSTLLIGRDDSSEAYTVLFYDSRGVSRVYQMGFDAGNWTMSRQAPGFWQRFSATMSTDRATIRGAWEKSPDGSTWEHDFDLIYTRVG
jgi:hypothetical protein